MATDRARVVIGWALVALAIGVLLGTRRAQSGQRLQVAAPALLGMAAAFTLVAVAWLLAHPAGIVPVMGTNTLERIAALDDALRVELDLEDWFILYTAALGHEVP